MFIKIQPYGVIYILRNKINNKIYIGQTVDFNRRINEHKNRKVLSSRKYNYKIARIIDEIGFDNFEYKILDSAYNKYELDYKEKHYIELHQSNNPDIGYNSRSGGLKERLNDVTRCLMSRSHLGLKESAETKRKKSNKIIAVKDNKCYICDSGKLFGDFIGMSKDKVKNALRMPCKIKGYFIFYLDEKKRYEMYIKSKNSDYKDLYKLIGADVEAIESLFETHFISYK